MFGIVSWEDELLQGLGQVKYQEQPPLPQNLVESDRWVCASAMQKAIRRNQSDIALKAAFSLRYLKPEQLWSRLRVIAQEDIGAACPLLVGQVLWVAGKKVWRQQNGGEDKILSYLITQMCKSSKSRMANDLLILSNWHPDYKQACETLADYEVEQLEKAILNPDTPVVLKSIAAQYVAGTSKRHIFNLLEVKGSPARLISIYEAMGCPEWLLDITRMSITRGEGHGVTMPLSWIHQEMSKTVQLKDECLEASIQIGEWNSEAFDAHTRDGKKAYNLFLKKHPVIKNFLNLHFMGKNHNEILGMVVFGLEGHLMNNRITYLSEQKLTAKALESYVDENYRGDVKAELEGLVKDKFEDINICRKEVLSV